MQFFKIHFTRLTADVVVSAKHVVNRKLIAFSSSNLPYAGAIMLKNRRAQQVESLEQSGATIATIRFRRATISGRTLLA